MPRRNRLALICVLAALSKQSFAVPEDKKEHHQWSRPSQWLYNAMAARFEDHAGKYTEALNTMTDVAVQSGEYDALEYGYGLAWDTHDFARAEQIARVWLSAFPNDNDARLALLRVLLVDSRSNEALGHMQSLLNTDGGPQNVAQIFRVLADYPDSDERLNLLQKLSQEFPKNPYLHYYLGLMAKEQGQVSIAVQAFDDAIALDGNWRELELMQAQVLASIGKLQEARKIMDRMINRYPQDINLLSSYIDMLSTHYQWQDALTLALRWKTLQPQDMAVRQLIAQLHAAAGNYSAALQAYRELLDAHQIDINGYLFSAANAAVYAGEDNVATTLLGEISQDSPRYLQAQEQLALLAFRHHDYAQAQERFATLRKTFPDDAQVLDTYLIEAAQLQQAQQWNRLEKLLQEALSRYPEQVDLLYVLAEFYASRGNIKEAEEQFSKILRIDPANIDALNAYGYLLLTQTKEDKKAAEMIQAALNLYPDSPAIQDSYGWLLFRQGKTEEALAWLRRAYAAYRSNEISAHYIEILYASGDKQLAEEVYRYERQGQPDNIHLKNIGKKLGITDEKTK
ncbi:MAG: tetratricopeptide repeat protein [Cardiobacteriaceae bacterium]|nr:tetratricopeptide repeat protein [Cardiobacteriaceae bacterium]